MDRGFPSMTALLGLLAVAGFQNRDKLAEMLGGIGGMGGSATPTPNTSSQACTASPVGMPNTSMPGSSAQGGLMQGGLGGLLANLGLGGQSASPNAGNIIDGGIGGLVERFRQAGRGDVADSWVNHGPNQEITPHDLRSTIGQDTLNTLSQSTGLSEEELLSRLSRTLPDAVDRYTPQGRLSNS